MKRLRKTSVEMPAEELRRSLEIAGLPSTPFDDLREVFHSSQKLIDDDGNVLFWIVENRAYRSFVRTVESLEKSSCGIKNNDEDTGKA